MGNKTPLHWAVIKNNINIVEKFLRAGARVNCVDNFKRTPLHYVQSVYMARLLLDMGADTEVKDINGQTPLLVVTADNYNSKLVKLLLERGSLVSVKDDNGDTPLHLARGLITVQLLLDSGIAVNVKNRSGQTPFHRILLRNNGIDCTLMLRISNLLLQSGADINATDCNGYSPLHIAFYYNLDLEFINWLLCKGANIDQKDKNGRTPLAFGLSRSCRNARLLLREEGNVNPKNKEEYPLHFALSNLDMKSIQDVVCTGHQIKYENKKCQTPLHIAVLKNFHLGVKYLLEKGFQVNVRDKVMRTPLHYAVLINSEKVVTTLIDKGADLDVKDNVGFTPLHCAVLARSWKSFEILLNKNANINCKDINGQSPLHIAVFNGCSLLIEKLLQKGADLNQRDNDGNTPLHFAVMMTENIFIVRDLLSRGAEVDIQNVNGQTPLHIAVEERTRQFFSSTDDSWLVYDYYSIFSIISMLFDKGASLDIADNKNRTPLLLHLSSGVPQDIDIWTKEAIKLECANLITHDIENEVDSILSPLDFNENDSYRYVSFKMLCEVELDKMRKDQFGGHSLYTVFSNYTNPTYVKINAIEETINSQSLDAEYPIYASLLRVMFVRAKHRHILLDNIELNFPVQSGNIVRTVQLPNEIKRKFLSYLSDNDLRNIQKANEEICTYSSDNGKDSQPWATPKYLLPSPQQIGLYSLFRDIYPELSYYNHFFLN